MYRTVPKDQIANDLVHLRNLFRSQTWSEERDQRAHERREVVTKNLLSNLVRTKEHPTLATVMEVAKIFSLTLDGAHQLFGYDLEQLRSYDLLLNRGRTHIIESYPFQRDQLVDLPGDLAGADAFSRDAALNELVPAWQTNVPIRALEEHGWQHPGTFYVHVGTEDSFGSGIPPGSTVLVEPVTEPEALRPSPRSTYLLQFGNGYRCSRCVVSRNKLLLLSADRSYKGPQSFFYPGGVRIAGRIRAFALSLPVVFEPSLDSFALTSRGAPLILPWEHDSLDRLLAADHLRFRRSREERNNVRETLEQVFQSRLNERTERRYRRPTRSQPHIDTLLQLSLLNMVRYTDALRSRQFPISDAGRFSLGTLLNADSLDMVASADDGSHLPRPTAIWESRKKEYGEWPTLLSAEFPQLRAWQDRIVRLAVDCRPIGIDPKLSAGTLVLLEGAETPILTRPEVAEKGWARPLYALRRGTEFILGHLEMHGSHFALLHNPDSANGSTRLEHADLKHLRKAVGVSVPV